MYESNTELKVIIGLICLKHLPWLVEEKFKWDWYIMDLRHHAFNSPCFCSLIVIVLYWLLDTRLYFWEKNSWHILNTKNDVFILEILQQTQASVPQTKDMDLNVVGKDFKPNKHLRYASQSLEYFDKTLHKLNKRCQMETSKCSLPSIHILL